LLEGLQQNLGDKDARLRRLEDDLNKTQELLRLATERLGQAWNDMDVTVRGLESEAAADAAAQRRAFEELAAAQRKTMEEDLDMRERELMEEVEETRKRWDAEWREAEQCAASERERAANDTKKRDEDSIESE
jgi:hypothetical protein